MNLNEYARLHPQSQPEQEREEMEAQAETIFDKQKRRDDAEHLKSVILQQLEGGREPQAVLYTALQCIGLLSDDPEWTEAGEKYLDQVFSDLAQQSLIINDEEEAAKRLDTMQKEYREKLRRQLNRQLVAYKKIETALRGALSEVNGLDLDDEQEMEIL